MVDRASRPGWHASSSLQLTASLHTDNVRCRTGYPANPAWNTMTPEFVCPLPIPLPSAMLIHQPWYGTWAIHRSEVGAFKRPGAQNPGRANFSNMQNWQFKSVRVRDTTHRLGRSILCYATECEFCMGVVARPRALHESVLEKIRGVFGIWGASRGHRPRLATCKHGSAGCPWLSDAAWRIDFLVNSHPASRRHHHGLSMIQLCISVRLDALAFLY